MATRTILLDNFHSGEFGDLDPSSAPPTSFTGRNVLVYRDGLLGPRAGLKRITPSGLSNGSVLEFGAAKGTNGVVYVQSTAVIGWTFPSGAATAIGTAGAAPAQGDGHMVRAGNSMLYYLIATGAAYELTPATPALSAMTSSPAARAIAQYGERVLLVGASGANYRRLRYSAKADPDSWPALNFIDIPYPNTAQEGFTVTYITDLRQRLLIANDGGEWWALSGVPGVNDVLRRQQRGDRVPASRHSVARVGESVYFICSDGAPATFSGTTTEKDQLRHLKGWASAETTFRAASRPDIDSFMALAANERVLLLANDAWTFHTLGVPIAYPFITSVADAPHYYLICDGGSASTPPAFYVFDSDLNRPGIDGDTYAAPGDNSTTPVDAEFTTAVRWGKDGEELKPSSITVNFDKWNTGSPTANGFQLEVIAYHRHNQSGTRSSDAYEFSEPATATPANRTPHSHRFGGGNQGFAQGFQIRVYNLRGCAIRSIYVDCETR